MAINNTITHAYPFLRVSGHHSDMYSVVVIARPELNETCHYWVIANKLNYVKK